jgi:uncharacterized cofD-like protein
MKGSVRPATMDVAGTAAPVTSGNVARRPSAAAVKSRDRARRVVTLGGGTGLPVLLRGLGRALFSRSSRWIAARDRERLTAVVTAADDGGSSGRLRRAYGVLPPGDIRNCLLALASGDPTLTALFSYRFNGQEGEVGGHNLGNLILTALNHLENDFVGAVERAHRILDVRGRVFPATLADVRLLAEFADGTRIEGESRIAAARRPIRRVRLEPADAPALPQVREAIADADLVVLGPGSLYTSLIPVLLVPDVTESIASSRARVVLVMNLMTEPGETDGADAREHLLAIRRHAPTVAVDDVLVNVTPIPRSRVERYAALGAVPICSDLEILRGLGCRVVARDLLDASPMVRHDSDKLARAVLELVEEAR